MLKNNYGGLLVAIDGPNGVGKSTLIKQVQVYLQNSRVPVWITKEPSASDLGSFTRKIAESLCGNSLACLVAADRYCHLENEIIPHLKENDVVLLDRYVLSSLILQRMDNVDVSFILSVNDKIILPDIQFAITANADTIQVRLHERTVLTRFEQNLRTNEELKYLQEGVNILAGIGVHVKVVYNNGDLNNNVAFMIENIEKAGGIK